MAKESGTRESHCHKLSEILELAAIALSGKLNKLKPTIFFNKLNIFLHIPFNFHIMFDHCTM